MKTGYRILIIAAVGLLLGALVASTAYALPPGQDPRPPDNGNGGSGGSGSNGENNGSGAPQRAAENCATLSGQVLNWGVGGLGSIGVSLETGSWQVNTASASDGNYAFGGLGVGIARLKVTLPPELGGSLTPLIQDAGVYLNCDAPTIANIAVYSGDTIAPAPPVTLELSAPGGVTPGKSTVIRAHIENNLPTDITNVMLTSLMTPGLTPTQVDFASTTANTTEILDGGADGQMVYIYLPSIAAGLDENILITVAAAPDLLNNMQLKNTATLFYRESVAVQSSLELRVGGEPLPAAAPATATPVAPTTAITETMAAEAATPVATATIQAEAPLTTTTAAEDMGDEFVPPKQMPTTGDDLADEFVAPPGLLPETGIDSSLPQTLPNTGIGLLLPLLGMGFGGLAFALHHLRRRF